MPKKKKVVYFFGAGKAEGKANMRDILGGKGAGLHEMTRMGAPVPPGFTITTDVCSYYYAHHRQYPKGLDSDVKTGLARIEKLLSRRFGDPENPLLVSVRSGARESMPGMMDTVLNLGLNDETVAGLARQTNNERFAWDAYRRFVQMFGRIVLNVEGLDKAFEQARDAAGAKQDTDLNAQQLHEITEQLKSYVQAHTGKPFPTDVTEQLELAI